MQLLVVRGFVRFTDDVDWLKGWLVGDGVLDGVTMDADLCWIVML